MAITLPLAYAQLTLPDPEWTILAGYRGSHAHGTAIEPDDPMGTDDVDLMAVVVPPPSHYLGLDSYGSRGTREVKNGPYDVVAYEARKFVSLLAKGNPNVLGLLWLDEDANYAYTHYTGTGALLIAARDQFTLTKQTIRAHIGYAQAQRAKMEAKPTAQAYMGERRRALAERFGYDTKHAAHMIRLLVMVNDLMIQERLIVDRSHDLGDAPELIATKRGQYSLAEVLTEADEQLDRARHLESRCTWPDRVDPRFASDLCAEVVRTAWRERGEMT